MGKPGHTIETIVAKMREAEVLMAKGETEVGRKWDIRDATYYESIKEYVVLQVDQAKRYKELEEGNHWPPKRKIEKVMWCASILAHVCQKNIFFPASWSPMPDRIANLALVHNMGAGHWFHPPLEKKANPSGNLFYDSVQTSRTSVETSSKTG